MAKEKDDKDLRTRDFVREMETYAMQNGYSRDTALDQLIFVMTAFFSIIMSSFALWRCSS